MDISLVNAGLAAGAGLAALPVILHLFMKQKPKHVIFPALRLIRERQKRSKKRLRIKNWLLLLARMALLALMALALARPTIVSQASVGDQDVPTAIGLVFDTSLSMGYKERDKTRLDEAKERALEIVTKTSSSSQIYVVDSAEPAAPPPLSPGAARKRIEALTLRTINRPLNIAVGQAYSGVAESERPRHEVYVFTDLARSAWDVEHPVEGLDKAKKFKTGIKTYVLRLNPPDVHDVSVVDAHPSADVVTEGEPLEIIARLRSLGPATKRQVELWLDGVVRDKKGDVEFAANGEQEVRFTLPNVDGSISLHQGFVRVTGVPDPLEFDDIRYFTFRVKPATKVLVVSDLDYDNEFITGAIDPDPATLPPGSPRPYRVERVRTPQFLEKADQLNKRYRCVFLNNVATLRDAEWAKLSGFVLDGGGLVIGLGNRCQPESYRSGAAPQLLPAELDQPKKEPTTFGQIRDLTHPLFNRFPKELDAALSLVPVRRYWSVKGNESARVLLEYADKAPALLERVFKGSRTGRVLLWTTPLARRPDDTSSDAWNEFPEPIIGWSFFHLMNQTVAYLSGSTEEGLTFESGRDVLLPIDPTHRYKNYNVVGPDKKTSDRLTPTGTDSSLVIVAPQQIGQWTVSASGDEGAGETLGFSVNPPASESRFVPLEPADLNKLFGGKDGYALAVDQKSLGDMQILDRVGRELFPWLIIVIMMVVTAENLLANRFYRESQPRAVPEGA